MLQAVVERLGVDPTPRWLMIAVVAMQELDRVLTVMKLRASPRLITSTWRRASWTCRFRPSP